jgi:hypothetical protein
VSVTQETDRRDWDWERDGALPGLYRETRQVTVRNGPSAGLSKLVFDFDHADTDETVSAWQTAVLLSKFKAELKRRGKDDFEPGERIDMVPTGTKTGINGRYRDFDVTFEYAAPRPTAAQLLGAYDDDDDTPAEPSDDLFGGL